MSDPCDRLVVSCDPSCDPAGGVRVPGLFECHWCPRNPAIIHTASFDGHTLNWGGGGGGGGGKEEVPVTHKILCTLCTHPEVLMNTRHVLSAHRHAHASMCISTQTH